MTPPGQWAGQKLSRVKCLAQHGTWWADGEHWCLPKEGLGHQPSLSHSQIVGLGKDWQCEGSNHSNFCSFWSDLVGEMSHKLTKCHRSFGKHSFRAMSVSSLVLDAVRRGTRKRRGSFCLQGAYSHGYSQTLMSGKNVGGNLGFLASHLHVEGPLSGQHFLPRFSTRLTPISGRAIYLISEFKRSKS